MVREAVEAGEARGRGDGGGGPAARRGLSVSIECGARRVSLGFAERETGQRLSAARRGEG